MSYAAISKNGKGIAEKHAAFGIYDVPCSEMRLTDFSGALSSDKIASLCNLRADGAALVSVASPTAIPKAIRKSDGQEVAFDSGAILGELEADGVLVFRKGNDLYARKDGTFYLLAENRFTAPASTVYYTDGTFFVTDEECLWRVSKALTVTEASSYVPTCFTDVAVDGSTKTVAAKPNLFSPYFEIVFAAEGSQDKILPTDLAVDPSYARLWNVGGPSSGQEITAGYFSFDGTKVHLASSRSNAIRVRLKLAESADATKFSLSSDQPLRERFSLAGKTARVLLEDGRTVYFPYGAAGGNARPKQIEALLVGSASDLTRLTADDILSIPCAEEILAYAESPDGLLVFTDRAICKLDISLSGGNVQMKLSPVKRGFGCDMPGTICQGDNHIFFADSRGGVYCLDKFGVSERDIARHLSEAIEGEGGFFSHTAEERAAATAVCAFGKFYLSIGTKTYVLDVSDGIPSDGKHANWTVLDVVKASCYLTVDSAGIFFCETTTGSMKVLSPRGTAASGVMSTLTTVPLDFGKAGEKIVLRSSLRAAGGDASVTFAFDGETAPDSYTLTFSEHPITRSVKLPPRRFETCTVTVSSSAPIRVEALGFLYR